MTFYLKYRPQTAAGLDLHSVRQEFEAILASGRFAHAYLFAGPRGTGKTSAARILAKIVNCKRNEKASDSGKRLSEPCNVCVSCREITQGNALDLFEIDAASNRGIDDIRELRERIKLAPARSRFKVYIIDEVHMLTQEAFNALLKTLEEPPLHALFILCTTEPQKLPATILSRAQRFSFLRPTVAQITTRLEQIAKSEKWGFGKEALHEIAKAADGAFRDAEVLLEKIAAVNTKADTAEVKKI